MDRYAGLVSAPPPRFVPRFDFLILEKRNLPGNTGEENVLKSAAGQSNSGQSNKILGHYCSRQLFQKETF